MHLQALIIQVAQCEKQYSHDEVVGELLLHKYGRTLLVHSQKVQDLQQNKMRNLLV
jgi:hypothetical protein